MTVGRIQTFVCGVHLGKILTSCRHRRSQDFVCGGTFFLKKVEDLFLLVTLNRRSKSNPYHLQISQ